ncbi:MAG TPA: cytoplasmic protein [Desulfobacterales bacterium]|nr:cytoplasmic protein [Desulfobacterales bacterium]
MKKRRVLLVGETWITTATHYKGWDHFTSTTFHDGAVFFKQAIKQNGFEVEHLPGHLAPSCFPTVLDELFKYTIIVLSDIGANSLLLHDNTWLRGMPTPNRLELIAEYVRKGGRFLMVGGYMSFQGIHGRAAYKGTPIEEILPVELLSFDDRKECPQGVIPEPGPDFKVLNGAPKRLPKLLGYNRTNLKPDAYLVYQIGHDPLLALIEEGKGRTAAWTSDIGPHWCSDEFLKWAGYPKLWGVILHWLEE